MDNIRIIITEEEWLEFPKKKRERLKKLLVEKYGWDVSELNEIEREHERDLFRKYFGKPPLDQFDDEQGMF